MNERQKWNIQTGAAVALAIVSIVFLGVIGRMDYDDAKLAERNYCANVSEGVWPDYRHIYKKVCTEYEKGVDNVIQAN